MRPNYMAALVFPFFFILPVSALELVILPSGGISQEVLILPIAERAGAARVAPAIGGGGAVADPNPGGGTGVAEATTALRCGNTTYTITTGSSESGKCTGKGSSRTCTDGKGNSAKATCSGGCGDTSGGGSCVATKH